MKYITGEHALNINCSLLTSGDWHQSFLRWEDITFRDTKDSIFSDYGIEHNKSIPKHDQLFSVANHIRALLDLLEMGMFNIAQGMNDDFIGNDDYNPEVFDKVGMMYKLSHWNQIDEFMLKEYSNEWINFKALRDL